MQICDKQYQSLNISASPSFATAQGRENERRDWTEETYLAKNKQPGNRYEHVVNLYINISKMCYLPIKQKSSNCVSLGDCW